MIREETTKQDPIGIVITGACGRMGKTVWEMASKSIDIIVKALIEREGHSSIGKKISMGELRDNAELLISPSFPDGLSRNDIVIDFSTRHALPFLINKASRMGLRYVCGTTGLSAKDMEILKSYSKETAVLYDSNMSFGISVIKELLRILSGMLGDGFDVDIVEQHHRYKKDRPSGTAISLARELEREFKARHDSRSDGAKVNREHRIHSIRAGGIAGEHKVIFASDEEIITLAHRALNRQVFARGALRAARFLSSKKNGLFSMRDLLNDGNDQ